MLAENEKLPNIFFSTQNSFQIQKYYWNFSMLRVLQIF